MSKKKAFSGSTMTLKDFHGGSIPSDLPLPSAPGVTARPSDRAGFDRHSSWGNPMGRPDHRLRPGSSPAAKSFDDKTPFLAPTARIGRNFDEDERKPLDGVSVPRRTVSDESIYAPPSRGESKPDSYSARLAEAGNMGISSGRQVLTTASHLPSANVSTYSGRLAETNQVGMNSQNLGSNSGTTFTGSYPNAWAARKDAVGTTEPLPSAWSGPAAVSKLAQASALEKVSSGRWQSKQPIHYQADVEVIQYSEIDSGLHAKGTHNYVHTGTEVLSGREYFDSSLARHADRGLIEDGTRGGGKELQCYETARSPMHLEAKERNHMLYTDEFQSAAMDGKFGKFELQPPVPSEASERPKLKLLPRSRPLDGLEPPSVEYKQLSEFASVETAIESHATFASAKVGSAGVDSRLPERPKLNLKPRSQPLEKLDGSIERERKMLFGGARPRELVLKERGIDDVTDNDVQDHPPNRVKNEVAKTEIVSGHAIPARYTERAENLPLDHRIGKTAERKDRVDVERADGQRRNWRNENWRNSKEIEKQQQQQQQERERSPETWRKPVEQPKPASPDASGVRYGKVASAVELAQAFSRSISDSKTSDQFSSPRNLSGQSQMPFSRLMGSTSRPQINGY
ncbi:uncharacterized protein LOC131166099 [Malania oleifera]|uniref:uncharacterized protein LOC131166099 n=1 Tax=Malania oleifera TaxID=397392 RepID=UPI0025AE8D61|nr:uncharacterized protein LOC131166099 [Malania oleifera]XP_057980365.1 uncharacterized protein LOC131166099 [Malania oleifera]XP_057980366.1 uncharacterized protein LOC131166099 [Malania oleifera]